MAMSIEAAHHEENRLEAELRSRGGGEGEGKGGMMTTEKRVATRPADVALAGPNLIDAHQLEVIQANIELLETKVKAMLRPGEDYGRLPGMQKPTLFDSGAGTIRAVYNIYPDQELLLHEENSEGIRYIIKVKGIHRDTGRVVASGVGSASSGEIKYAYRWVSAKELGNQPKEGLKTKEGYNHVTLYRIDNPDIPDLDNTLLKMAAKRAEVDMTLQLPGVSRVFTQDIGDLKRPPKTSGPGPTSSAFEGEDSPEPEGRPLQERQGVPSDLKSTPQDTPEASRPALEQAQGSQPRSAATGRRMVAFWAERTGLETMAEVEKDLGRVIPAWQQRKGYTGRLTEAQAQEWLREQEELGVLKEG